MWLLSFIAQLLPTKNRSDYWDWYFREVWSLGGRDPQGGPRPWLSFLWSNVLPALHYYLIYLRSKPIDFPFLLKDSESELRTHTASTSQICKLTFSKLSHIFYFAIFSPPWNNICLIIENITPVGNRIKSFSFFPFPWFFLWFNCNFLK